MLCFVIHQTSASLLADYIFEDSLSGSLSGAPDIVHLGSSVVYEDGVIDGNDVRAIQIDFNTGLSLEISQWSICDDYTVVLHGYIDDVTSYKKLIDFRNLSSDSGLYNRSGFVSLLPGLEAPTEQIVANEYFQLAVTRDSNHLVTIYLNGVFQLEYSDISLSTSMCFTDQFTFFVDDSINSEHPRGAVSRVTIYDHTLSAEEIGNLEVLDVIFSSDFDPELP